MNQPTYKSGLLQTKAYRILRGCVNEILEKYSLSTPEWGLMGQVTEKKDGVRLSEVAGALDVEAPMITVLADQLEKKGLIDRHNHPQDRRAKLLFLTKKGSGTVVEVEALLQKKLRELLQGLTQEDMVIYSKVLETIIANSSRMK